MSLGRKKDDHSIWEEGITEKTHDGIRKEFAWEVEKNGGTEVKKKGFCEVCYWFDICSSVFLSFVNE